MEAPEAMCTQLLMSTTDARARHFAGRERRKGLRKGCEGQKSTKSFHCRCAGSRTVGWGAIARTTLALQLWLSWEWGYVAAQGNAAACGGKRANLDDFVQCLLVPLMGCNQLCYCATCISCNCI